METEGVINRAKDKDFKKHKGTVNFEDRLKNGPLPLLKICRNPLDEIAHVKMTASKAASSMRHKMKRAIFVALLAKPLHFRL